MNEETKDSNWVVPQGHHQFTVESTIRYVVQAANLTDALGAIMTGFGGKGNTCRVSRQITGVREISSYGSHYDPA